MNTDAKDIETRAGALFKTHCLHVKVEPGVVYVEVDEGGITFAQMHELAAILETDRIDFRSYTECHVRWLRRHASGLRERLADYGETSISETVYVWDPLRGPAAQLHSGVPPPDIFALGIRALPRHRCHSRRRTARARSSVHASLYAYSLSRQRCTRASTHAGCPYNIASQSFTARPVRATATTPS